jgi:DNA-directed RNA polymerase subunit L
MLEQRERMAENTMASIENTQQVNCGHEYHCEFKGYPPTFVNSIRRILLSDIPTVVVRDVEILENGTQIPHEMLKHRVEMLPVNVLPADSNVIRDAKIELRILPDPKERWIYTSDFVVTKGRDTMLMGDRDTGAPLVFVKVRPNETLHIKAGLSVETKTASQVCVSTLSYHIDPEIAREERELFIEDGGEPAVFDNFYIQRCYSKDDKGRPTWIDLNVESIGVIPARELVRMAGKLLKQKVSDYMEYAVSNIARHKDNEYSISLQIGGHTELAVLQEIMYSDLNVNFVSYDIPHPLKSDTIVRFHSKSNPETILKNAHAKLDEYCDILEKSV